MNKKIKGFTLLEVLIATSILVLIIALMYPVFASSKQAGNLMNRLDTYHDTRRIDQEIFSELKFGTDILYPPKCDENLEGDWYHQLVFRNHLNQIIILYVNENDKLMIFNYDNVKNSYLSLGKPLDTNKIKDFSVRRKGSSVVEYRLTFDIGKKDFVVTNQVTLMNVF